MNEAASWTPMERLLFTTLVPLLGLVVLLAVTAYLHSDAQQAPRAAQVGSVSTKSARREDALRARREAFETCVKGSGVDLGGGFRTRFSPRPDPAKIREVRAICLTLLEHRNGPTPASHASAGPPIA